VDEFWVEAPCFSREKLDFSPAEKRLILKWALATGFPMPGAKAHDQSRPFPGAAEALLPSHKCGGFHQEAHATSCAQSFSAACSDVPQRVNDD